MRSRLRERRFEPVVSAALPVARFFRRCWLLGLCVGTLAASGTACVDLTRPRDRAEAGQDAARGPGGQISDEAGAAGGSGGVVEDAPAAGNGGAGGSKDGPNADNPQAGGATGSGGKVDAALIGGATVDAALDHPQGGTGGTGGSHPDASPDVPIGGRGGTGGTTTSRGGSGGTSTRTGGAGAGGGGYGGRRTGGSATGGSSSTGGVSTGGSATGGSSSTGGSSTGGLATGGNSGSGGSSTGGTGGATSTGGTGGSGTGGATSGDGGVCSGYVSKDADAGLTEGLVAYYSCNQTSGPSLTDNSSNGKNGTIMSGAGGSSGYSFAAGKVNNALDFPSGNKGSYVSLPSGLLANACEATVATWVYLNSEQNWQRIFDFGKDQNIYMCMATQNNLTQKLRFAITVSGNAAGHEQFIDGTSAIPTGAWHHVAIVLGPTGGILYLDGTQVGSNTAMTLRPADLGNLPNYYIGRSEFSDPYLDGNIDEFRIYERALSPSEIQSLASGS